MTTLTTKVPDASLPLRGDSSGVVGFMTIDEYTAFEQTAEQRHDYQEGWVTILPGGSLEHNRIVLDTARAFSDGLENTGIIGEVFGDGQQVRINNRRFVYPDMVLVVGETQADQNDRLANPFLIVEVLSSSTESEDRGEKFDEYKTIPSLCHYLLIEQSHIGVTHFAKAEGGEWQVVGAYRDLADTLTVAIGEATLLVELARIYRRVFGS